MTRHSNKQLIALGMDDLGLIWIKHDNTHWKEAGYHYIPRFSLNIITSLPHQTIYTTSYYWNRSRGYPLHTN